jgi:hypothetical protein
MVTWRASRGRGGVGPGRGAPVRGTPLIGAHALIETPGGLRSVPVVWGIVGAAGLIVLSVGVYWLLLMVGVAGPAL